MVNECSVVGCHTGYRNGTVKPVFQFPRNSIIRLKWIEFLNRQFFTVTNSSRICIDHFDQKYIIKHSKRPRLNYSLNPIPTILPNCIPKSQAVVPKPIRKLPKVRIFQPDQLEAYKTKFSCHNLTDVVNYIHELDEYKSFLHTLTETSFTTYRLIIQSGIAQVKECIDISVDGDAENDPKPKSEFDPKLKSEFDPNLK